MIETTLRVATWNLWWRFGPWEDRLPLIIEELRRVDADVVALQEVWGDGDDTSAKRIAAQLGYEETFAARLELGESVRFGNAVLSRWPIAHTEWHPLPAAGHLDEQRLVLRADIDGPRGSFQVFSTHLNWRFDHSAVRQEQARTVAEVVAAARPRSFPPIVCGDFNAEPASTEVGMLTGLTTPAVDDLVLMDAWRVAHPNAPGFTWDNRNPFVAAQLEYDRRIDYVFVGWPKAEGAGHVVSAELIGTEPTGAVWPSDHFGVVAEIRY